MSAPAAPADRARLVTVVAVAGLLLFTYAHYVEGRYLGRSYPADSFLGPSQDAFFLGEPTLLGHGFSDFWQSWTAGRASSPYLGSPDFLQPTDLPLMAAVLRLTSGAPFVPVLVAYLVGLLVVLPLLVLRALRGLPGALRVRTAVVLGVGSYPALYLLDRGSVVGLSALTVVGALVAARRRPLVSAVLLGCAVALDGFPLVLVAWQLAERRYRDAAVSLSVAVALTLGSLVTFSGALADNVRALSDVTVDVLHQGVLPHTSDAVDLLLALGAPASLAQHAGAVAVVVLALAAAYVLAVRPRPASAASLLVLVLVLAPRAAGDARLVLLLVPVVLFVQHGSRYGDDRVVALLWGAALLPLTLPLLPGAVGVGLVVRPLLLLALVAHLVAGDVRDRRDVPSPEVVRAAA